MVVETYEAIINQVHVVHDIPRKALAPASAIGTALVLAKESSNSQRPVLYTPQNRFYCC